MANNVIEIKFTGPSTPAGAPQNVPPPNRPAPSPNTPTPPPGAGAPPTMPIPTPSRPVTQPGQAPPGAPPQSVPMTGSAPTTSSRSTPTPQSMPAVPPPGAPPQQPPTGGTPPRFGPNSQALPGSPGARAIPLTPQPQNGAAQTQEQRDRQGRQDYLDRTRVSRAFEEERRARLEMEEGLAAHRKRKEEEAWQQTQKMLAKWVIAPLAVATQMLGTANQYLAANRSIQGQRIRGQVQEADIAQKDADLDAASDVVGYVGAGIGFAVGGPLGAAIGYGVGRVVKGVGDLFNASEKAFMERSKAFDEVIQRAAQYSPEVALASARRDINRLRNDMREARVLGPDLAKLEEAKSRLDTINGIKTMNQNLMLLGEQIKGTDTLADLELEIRSAEIMSSEMVKQFSPLMAEYARMNLEALKKLREEKPDYGPIDELLRAGRIMAGDWAQRPKQEPKDDGMLNVPLLLQER